MNELKKIIDGSDNIVFFGGAGVSTESGIPDFRSASGLYNQQHSTQYSPEQMLSYTFFEHHTKEFFDYYKNNLIYRDAKPSGAHKALAKLEEMGKLKAVITQNIDGLHQLAGSKKVLELHGSVLKNYCKNCMAKYDIDYVMKCDGIPKCEKCGGVVRPDVVLYEEALNGSVMAEAMAYIEDADVLIIGGTSLMVYPAAGMVGGFRGRKLVLMNATKTQYDNRADLIIREPLGKTLYETVCE